MSWKWKILILTVLFSGVVCFYYPSFNIEETKKFKTDLTMDEVERRIKELTNCLDKNLVPRIEQRGDFWVLYNYITAEKKFKCYESITYTTHGDYTFLDNLVPLVEKWQGPISVSLYAPGTDFVNTIASISYLRDCSSELIKQFVTFHIYFDNEHVPQNIPKSDEVLTYSYDCSKPIPFLNVSSDEMYKNKQKLLYPINVARNVARVTAQTHFVLASDLELYPSLNIIPQFLEMIAKNTEPSLSSTNPKVFPLHLFEVYKDQNVPENKTELLEMLRNETAIPFHKKVCSACHNIPKSDEWQKDDESTETKVFTVGKRQGDHSNWEPIYIGTNNEPLYDERLSWEGKKDKMTQGYTLCVMNYDFLVLNNAFLVHKPGIKAYKSDPYRDRISQITNKLIDTKILPELKSLFGVKEGCVV